jgi:cytidine deaminase
MVTVDEILQLAVKLASNSYAPYSGFRVAAVIEDSNGNLHSGVNVENASYGMTMCAERSAVYSAVSAGIRDFRQIVIYSPDGLPLPCGACRQVLREFCGGNFTLTVVSDGRPRKEYRLQDLLPEAFEL